MPVQKERLFERRNYLILGLLVVLLRDEEAINQCEGYSSVYGKSGIAYISYYAVVLAF